MVCYAFDILKEIVVIMYLVLFKDTATTEIYTRKIVGSVRCV